MEDTTKGSPRPSEGFGTAYTTAYSFVGRYFDPGLEIPRAISRESLVSSEIDRITGAMTIIYVVGSIRRRLGIEATDPELALDKKRAKRVGWALTQSLICWSKKAPKIQVTAEVQREGHHLEWDQFILSHVTQLNTDLRLLATWAIQNDESRWGRTAVVNLENELRWLNYAMRD